MIKRQTEHRPDGTMIERTEFDLTATRPVRDDVVAAMDDALASLGGEVLHAMDPTRILPFSHGGPPVWSVGIVEVAVDEPFHLLVTYGFSGILSPEPGREHVCHEYSLAVPVGVPLQPWADALLRHQCRYILSQGADIRIDDCIPLNGVPITRIAFQPQHHAALPDSTLVGIVCAADPVLPAIETPHGTIEVRRLIGIDALELDRVETWSVRGFVEELSRRDPLLLSPIARPSWMTDPDFRAAVESRAVEEGSEIDAAQFDVTWRATDREITFALPLGRGADRLREALYGRVGFGRRLAAFCPSRQLIAFEPSRSGVEVRDGALVVGGDLDTPALRALIGALETGVDHVVIAP